MFSKFFQFSWSYVVELEHDVEAIIANFTATVSRLEAAAEAKAKEAADHAEQALHFEALSAVADEASKRATDVAAKIKTLVA